MKLFSPNELAKKKNVGRGLKVPKGFFSYSNFIEEIFWSPQKNFHIAVLKGALCKNLCINCILFPMREQLVKKLYKTFLPIGCL